jgi:hypothetical protein
MLERDMRKQLVKLLQPLGAFAVENGGCHPGTPDIAFVGGWIECKATEQWPARADTPVRLDHGLSRQQRIWLVKWYRVNGRAFVMLNIAGEWLLFDGIVAASYLGGKEGGTRQELHEAALKVWDRTPKTEELLPLLESDDPA